MNRSLRHALVTFWGALSVAMGLVCTLAVSAGCENEPPRRPNLMHPVHERRAVEILGETFHREGVDVVVDQMVTIGKKPLRVDVAAAGHRFGIAYVTHEDATELGDAIPKYDPDSDALVVVDAIDKGGVWHVLLLYDRAYLSDDLEGEAHSATSIAAERKIDRDGKDFLVKAQHEQWP
jgi:hypothetical protein